MSERRPSEEPSGASQSPEPAPEPPPELSQYANPNVEIDQHVAPRSHPYPSTLGGFAYLLVVALTGYGLVVAWSGEWRTGVRWIAAAILADAALRLVIPERQTGMLHVRRRLVDVGFLVVLGVALLVVAGSISG